MPVPGAGGYYRTGPEQNPMTPGPPLFDMARSPPSGPNKSTPSTIHRDGEHADFVQTPSTFPASSSGKALVKRAMLVPSLTILILRPTKHHASTL